MGTGEGVEGLTPPFDICIFSFIIEIIDLGIFGLWLGNIKMAR